MFGEQAGANQGINANSFFEHALVGCVLHKELSLCLAPSPAQKRFAPAPHGPYCHIPEPSFAD